jgi:thiosulfate/3-mercaptopyruvate sulfurtransferase
MPVIAFRPGATALCARARLATPSDSAAPVASADQSSQHALSHNLAPRLVMMGSILFAAAHRNKGNSRVPADAPVGYDAPRASAPDQPHNQGGQSMQAIAVCIASIVAVSAGDDQVNPLARLYEPGQVLAKLDDPKVRILDARAKALYDKGHIPGAVWVDEAAAQKLASSERGLQDREAWAKWTEPLAITPDMEVIVYDGARQLGAARVWWLLGYLGVPSVGLMNGNFGLWEKAGHPVTYEATKVDARAFPVAFRAERHATRKEVIESLGDSKSQVVDARSRAEYTGAEAKSKRGGHVPEACHLEWTNVVDADGRFLDEPLLRTRFADAGLKSGSAVISHCQGGGRASVNAFVLERLGYKTRNYYLGWSDWGNAEETPVDK